MRRGRYMSTVWTGCYRSAEYLKLIKSQGIIRKLPSEMPSGKSCHCFFPKVNFLFLFLVHLNKKAAATRPAVTSTAIFIAVTIMALCCKLLQRIPAHHHRWLKWPWFVSQKSKKETEGTFLRNCTHHHSSFSNKSGLQQD